MRSSLILYFTLGIIFFISPVLSGEEAVACKELISRQERQKNIPKGLLKAIAVVESGISPWAVNARGRAHIFPSREAAARYIRKLIAEGVGNIGVGCMQLHYSSHHDHFKSIEEMLEPEKNIAHAAKILEILRYRYKRLDKAVKMYHSSSPRYHDVYQNRVYSMWAKIRFTPSKKRSGKPAKKGTAQKNFCLDKSA